MKSLGRWLLLGFIAMAIYGAMRPILITSTSASATLFKAAVPVAIGVAVLVGIVMSVAFFFNKGKGG